jgi:hypothetical protein
MCNGWLVYWCVQKHLFSAISVLYHTFVSRVIRLNKQAQIPALKMWHEGIDPTTTFQRDFLYCLNYIYLSRDMFRPYIRPSSDALVSN